MRRVCLLQGGLHCLPCGCQQRSCCVPKHSVEPLLYPCYMQMLLDKRPAHAAMPRPETVHNVMPDNSRLVERGGVRTISSH